MIGESRPTGWRVLTIIRLPVQIVLLALGTRGVVETDIWGHMRFGLDFLATHALPTIDRYNFTSTQHWVNLEWLSDALFAGAFSAGGLPLLAVLRAISLACAIVVFNRALRHTAWPFRDGLIAAIIFVSLPMLAAVRPQIFSVPLYGLTLLALQEDAVWLPAVFVLWANLHGGWLLGLGAVLVRTALEPTRRRLMVLAGCVVATLVTPYGYALWGSLVEALRRGWGDVLEWQPIWVLAVGREGLLIWLLLAAAVGWAAYRKLPIARWEWVWTLCVAAASARARRHIPFFGITVVLLMLAHVRRRPAPLLDQRLTLQTAAILTVPLLAAVVTGFVLLRPTLSCLPAQTPPVRPETAAVQFIRRADLRGRLLMWFDWGLYAIWHVGDRMQVSYDNRRETVYSAQVVTDHLHFYFGQQPDYPDRIAADYIWLPPTLPAVEQLTARGWHPIFKGPRSVILSRENRALVVDESPPTTPCFPNP